MRPVRFALAMVLLSTSTVAARAADSGTPYVLELGSHVDWGCQLPCACPVVTSPVSGTFRLNHRGFDGVFDNFDVLEVNWTVEVSDSSSQHWAGFGSYRVGGEFAITQELTLNLTYGTTTLRYDSGLVPGGGDFPRIQIAAPVDTTGCLYQVFNVVAAPALTSVPSRLTAGIARVRPNPFRTVTEFSIGLDSDARVTARVFDPAGRLVRTLFDGVVPGRGSRTLSWDGRSDDGARLRAGIYLLDLRVGERRARRTLVKLD